MRSLVAELGDRGLLGVVVVMGSSTGDPGPSQSDLQSVAASVGDMPVLADPERSLYWEVGSEVVLMAPRHVIVATGDSVSEFTDDQLETALAR